MQRVNRLCGLVIAAFGCYAIGNAVVAIA
jgi:hypothetical protein